MSIDKQKTEAASKPLVLIVMGVSGCGKSTLANMLANTLNIVALDADDLHSEQNKAHMASGKPLSDEMRLPWINAIRKQLEMYAGTGKSCVLAFSGLRESHRNMLRIDGATVLFIFLHGPKALIAERMTARQGHFMPSTLLDSQFEALQLPNGDDLIQLDIAQSIEELTKETLQELKKRNVSP